MTKSQALNDDEVVRARILQIMFALEQAGVTPVTGSDLQAFVYLANIIAPVWSINPIEGSILKTVDGPNSLLVTREIDRCVGQGLVKVSSLKADEEDPTKLSASYYLDIEAARVVLDIVNCFPEEDTVVQFLQELALSFSGIEDKLRDDSAGKDAAWTNPAVANNRVVDFAEFVAPLESPTANTLNAFQEFAPDGISYTPAEKVALYLTLLERRVHG